MQALLKMVRGLLGGSDPPELGDTTAHAEQNTPFSDPDFGDVLVVQQLLVAASNNRLPIELVDEIVDWAEYWPCITAKLDAQLVARGSSPRQDLLLLRTPPISSHSTNASDRHGPSALQSRQPRTKHPVRKIAFKLRSHDQGWSGEPPHTHKTYQHSYTWFDACIDRPLTTAPAERTESSESTQASFRPESNADLINLSPEPATRIPQAQAEVLRQSGYATLQPPVFPSEEGLDEEYHLQLNVQSKSEPTEHCIVWSYLDGVPTDTEVAALKLAGRGPRTSDGKFLRTLELDDCVSVWARARYPAWQNYVESAEVSVYFAV